MMYQRLRFLGFWGLAALVVVVNLPAQTTWYHVDGFSVVVADGLRIEADPNGADTFQVFVQGSLRPRVDGYVLEFARDPFADAQVIKRAIDLFSLMVADQSLARIDSIEVESQPDGDHWVILIESDQVSAFFYVLPVNGSPGGYASHVLLVPRRLNDLGRRDLLDVLLDIGIVIEEAAG